MFLIAQFILPQSTQNNADRIETIWQNQFSWNIGHVFIIISVPLIMLGFARIKELAQLFNPVKASIGLLLVLFGLGSELCIAALQLAIEGIVYNLGGLFQIKLIFVASGVAAVYLFLNVFYSQGEEISRKKYEKLF